MKDRHLKIVFLSIIFLGLITSCGKKEANSLSEKKAKLAELQKQVSSANTEIQKLQAEIEKIEPSKIEKIKTVAVSPIILSNFKHFVESTGRLESANNILVSPQTGGAITNMYVKVGDYVNKGQKIASIDNSILRNSIQEIQVQLETAQNIYERQKNLWNQKIGTEVQFIQAKSSVESLERRISTLRAQMNQNVVVAPISGTIDEVRFKAGEMAAPGVGIVRLINSNDLKVVANLPDTYAGTIAKGDMITIQFPDIHKEITANLNFVGQTIDPVSRTFIVEAKVPKLGNDFKPNLMAVVKVNDQSKAATIVIPENLIQNTEEGAIVYVAEMNGKNKVARKKLVKSGLSYDGKIEINAGLQASDLLITEGYQEIVDGQLINY